MDRQTDGQTAVGQYNARLSVADHTVCVDVGDRFVVQVTQHVHSNARYKGHFWEA